MTTWGFYYLDSGLFLGRSFSGPEELLAANTPDGCGALLGVFDRLSQRVDVTAVPPSVIEYQPPAPADDALNAWVWDAAAKRWVSMPTLASVKADKRKELRAAAAANARQTITVQNMEFEADDEALADLTREAFFARIDGAGFALTWQRANGAFVTLTDTQTIGLARAIRDRAEDIRQQLRERLQAVGSAATAPGVLAIGWTWL